ncbi:uncharacterized protein LOC143270299 [Peromyscus maniculatus bairdii]|uniref:uncharacterized protein LOC143270299 n=1 Tax=Peromyscus maniculatus bairdii TaxID=230844 RepID=UPI003FD016AB
MPSCAPPGARGRRRPSSAARRPPLRAPRTFALRLGPPLRFPRCRGRPRHVRRGGPGSAAPPRPLRGAPARLTPPASASGGRRPARATAQARPGRERGARCYVTARGVAFRKGRRFTIAEGVVLRCGTWLYDHVGRVTEEGPELYDDQGCGWDESAELYDTVGAWPEGGRGTLAPRWGRGLFTTVWVWPGGGGASPHRGVGSRREPGFTIARGAGPRGGHAVLRRRLRVQGGSPHYGCRALRTSRSRPSAARGPP